jgi:hypothetical protein
MIRRRKSTPEPVSLAYRRDAVSPKSSEPGKTFFKGLLWFVALWLLGFAGTALLVLPFHLMVAAAMHH